MKAHHVLLDSVAQHRLLQQVAVPGLELIGFQGWPQLLSLGLPWCPDRESSTTLDMLRHGRPCSK